MEGRVVNQLKEDCLRDTSDLELPAAAKPAGWGNGDAFANGEWRMQPSIMD
jgi:hypothetical protein